MNIDQMFFKMQSIFRLEMDRAFEVAKDKVLNEMYREEAKILAGQLAEFKEKGGEL